MSPSDPANPWAQTPPPIASPARRASIFVWIVGGLQAFGALGLAWGLWQIVASDVDQIHEMLSRAPRHNPALTRETIAQSKQLAPAMLAAVLLFGLLPAVAYLCLGLPVRRGRRGAIVATQMLLLIQCVALGLLFLSGLIQAVGQGNMPVLMGTLIFLGLPLALMGYTAWLLAQARQAPQTPPPSRDEGNVEPWNEED